MVKLKLVKPLKLQTEKEKMSECKAEVSLYQESHRRVH